MVALLVGWPTVSLTGEPPPGTTPTPAAKAEQPSGEVQERAVAPFGFGLPGRPGPTVAPQPSPPVRDHRTNPGGIFSPSVAPQPGPPVRDHRTNPGGIFTPSPTTPAAPPIVHPTAQSQVLSNGRGRLTETVFGDTHTYRINEPNVKGNKTLYPEVQFSPGDRITIAAGGCVQTGGSGATWKRYVKPSGRNANRLYFGTILIPGVAGAFPGMAAPPRLSLATGPQDGQPGQAWSIPPGPLQHLTLGYVDDGYGDNGYYSHDDGTDNQCKGIGNAYVIVTKTPGPPVRPLHIVAIGDSIMWGQGLHEESKFYTKVKIWLETQLGKPVEVHNAAHSGAKLFPGGNENEDIVLPGEVPFSSPTIVYQGSVRAPALVAPENVNLVLMDGCINDIGVAKILRHTSDDNDLRRETQEVCFTRMLAAMTAMSQKYPNAKLTVTGYYPIVSPQSSLLSIGPLLALHGVPLDPLTGIASVHERLTARSRIFADESSKALQQAVAIMNQRASNRFRFVPIPFSDENAYGAPHSLLWLIPVLPVVDEVYKLRLTECATIHILSPTCVPASTGHPNMAGAQVYADSIAGVLRQFVNEWK